MMDVDIKSNALITDLKIPDERGTPITFTADGQIKNYHYDSHWDFSSMESGNLLNRHVVSFATTDVKFRKSIQDVLYYIYGWQKQKNVIAPTSSQLCSWRLGFQHISSILGHAQWERLNEIREFQRFKRALKTQSLGRKTIRTNIIPAINKLVETGVIQRMIDGLELVALGTVKPTAQAIAIPVSMYQQLLTQSIAIVENYHDYRHDISDAFGELYVLRKELLAKGLVGSCISYRTRKLQHKIPNFNLKAKDSDWQRLQMACLVVVLAFSGARLSEALSFNKSSYNANRVNSSGSPIATLCGYTSKGNGGKPLLVTWQTHPIVKFALELAEDMSASIRAIYISDIYKKIATGEFDSVVSEKKIQQAKSAFLSFQLREQIVTPLNANSSRAINQQTEKFGIKAMQADVYEFDLLNPHRKGMLQVGEFLPKLSAHDFRRSFAVFFKRYSFGTAAGIKFQFKHQNINMSKYYANNADLMHMEDVLLDKDLLNELSEAGIELGIDIYDDIFNQSEHLSGSGGEGIARQKRLTVLNNGCDVFMSRVEIESHVRAGDFSIVQLPTGGYCTNPDCERTCGQVVFNAEIKPCMHAIYTDKGAKILAKQRMRLIEQFRFLNTGDRLKNSILAGLKHKIQDSELTLAKHKINYDPFNDRIVGTL